MSVAAVGKTAFATPQGHAATGGLSRLLHPRAIALIGASPDSTKLAGRPLAHLRKFGFDGRVHPVNPQHSEIGGVRCYASVADLPDGEYRLGRHTVTKCLGGVRLPDGTLAGSTLTMDQAFRNLVIELGLDLADASRRVSTNAADYLGLGDLGRLVQDAWADVVVLDRDLALTAVYVEGVAIGLST